MSIDNGSNSILSTSNSNAFGLSKDLKVPISLRLCYLQPANSEAITKQLARPSEKYSNPSVFRKLSKVYFNSDLFVKVEVMSGFSHSPITVYTHSLYHSFSNNKRAWNKVLDLPINYNQLGIDSYMKITIFELSNTTPVVFGIGTLSLFNTKLSTLRRGLQKVAIVTNSVDGDTTENMNYGDMDDLTDMELKSIKYENGEISKAEWLDRISLPVVEKLRDQQIKISNKDNDDGLFYLYMELPNFELPIVYSDITYNLPEAKEITKSFIDNRNIINNVNNTSVIINSVDINPGKGPNLIKNYDPDYHISNLIALNNIQTTINTNQNQLPMNINLSLDPMESKYHKLERNMNNSTLLDKELKPSPQLRDELLKILNKPSNNELNDIEKNLIWKFRYYFSKNNTTTTTSDNKDLPKTDTSKTNQKFFTKFLKSINWDNDFELDHAFNEIIPYYWSVDKIQIGDALELLSNYFDPFTLVSRVDTTQNTNDGNKETRFHKVFKYVRQLKTFGINRLRLASGDELLLYLLQLVQALKYESLIVSNELKNESLSVDEVNEVTILDKSPLASFLIEKSVGNDKLGNFFYWYVKVENEDQLNNFGPNAVRIYTIVLNKYIENLKQFSQANRLPNYDYLKRQVWFIKKLTNLVEIIRSKFKKNEATIKKVQFLREYLADSSNEFYKFPNPFPLPLDPSVIICGCYPEESSVFKSSLAPLKITFKTILNYKDSGPTFGRKNKYGKFTLMFKIGDDLRQDQLVIQIIDLMDQLLKNENLDLKLTPYKILATSPVAGMIQFVVNDTLDEVLTKNYTINESDNNTGGGINGMSGILNFLKAHSQGTEMIEPEALSVLGNTKPRLMEEQHAITSDLGVSSVVMDNYVKSCAGYCVITYILGVGDRHLDNLLLSPNGKFWHADFGYILGRDPKPFPPLMKLPIQVIDGMGGLDHENFDIFKNYCFVTYTTLRKNSNLILSLFQLMVDANIPDIQIDANRAVEKVQDKFCLEMTEEEAILHFQNLINDSVNAFLPVVIDRLHSLAQYWRA